MKKILPLLLLIVCCFLQSCEKETSLVVGTTSMSFDKEGGKETVSLVANKVWSASSNQSWCKVSPSSGDGSKDNNFTLTITCDANQTYDERTCQITITCEDKTTVINVSQNESKGVLVTNTDYSISWEKQSITIDIKSNMEYSVTVDESSKQWIDAVVTKGLTPSVLTLNISENDGVQRVGKVTIKASGVSDKIINIEQKAVPFVPFKDDIFKTYCVSRFDKNKDGEISSTEAFLVKEIDCKWDRIDSSTPTRITNLSGIEYFINLTRLDCSENVLTSLDVSGLTALTYLNCSGNRLTSLDISGCTLLTYLDCSQNYHLTNLDVSHLKDLTYLNVFSNSVTSLDISSCRDLTYLDCGSNQITSLDVSNCKDLEYLSCMSNQLTSIDVSDFKKLTALHCTFNPLTSLIVSGCSALSYLACYVNQLTSLNVSGLTALDTLDCWGGKLTSIEVSGCKDLVFLRLDTNQLTNLDISDCSALKELSCLDNRFASLDFSGCKSLSVLWCSGNPLISLDLSGCLLLSRLNCSETLLTSLDVSECATHMNEVYCRNIPNLKEIWLKTNQTIDVLQYDSDYQTTIKYK